VRLGTLPTFDRHGNLPIGNLFEPNAPRLSLLDATLAQIKERFVDAFPHSNTRQQVWDGWMRHRVELEKLGLPYASLVDGGFVTASAHPKDIDICLMMEAKAINDLQASDNAAYMKLAELTDTTKTKPLYLCDTYLIHLHSITSPRFPLMPRAFTYWARVFGSDRKNNPKNFLLVTQRGVI
jgi:hypothetical protein